MSYALQFLTSCWQPGLKQVVDLALFLPILAQSRLIFRGMLHLHCLIWLRGAYHITALRDRLQAEPQYADKIIDFIDCIIKCSIGENEEEDFREIAAVLQEVIGSCQKSIKCIEEKVENVIPTIVGTSSSSLACYQLGQTVLTRSSDNSVDECLLRLKERGIKASPCRLSKAEKEVHCATSYRVPLGDPHSTSTIYTTAVLETKRNAGRGCSITGDRCLPFSCDWH